MQLSQFLDYDRKYASCLFFSAYLCALPQFPTPSKLRYYHLSN